tara:strand:+ start:5321 stop:6259 length:939 start_codon:yes stop_codon:yes gene_type:complete
MKILITGSNGFIGKRLSDFLDNQGHEIVRLSWRTVITFYQTNQLSKLDWKSKLKDVDLVIHCAAKVHSRDLFNPKEYLNYELINTRSFIDLVKCAKEIHLKKIIFLSTIKVFGEYCELNKPIDLSSSINPKDNYSKSKAKSETELIRICSGSDTKYIIIRLPLVYGKDVRANFLKLLKTVFVNKIPFPIGSVNNLRSILYLENLINFVNESIQNPKANNQIFHLADKKPVSLPFLIRLIASGLNKKINILFFPVIFIRIFLYLIGKKSTSQSLFLSLYFGENNNLSRINWKQPYNSKDGIIATCNWFLEKYL